MVKKSCYRSFLLSAFAVFLVLALAGCDLFGDSDDDDDAAKDPEKTTEVVPQKIAVSIPKSLIKNVKVSSSIRGLRFLARADEAIPDEGDISDDAEMPEGTDGGEMPEGSDDYAEYGEIETPDGSFFYDYLMDTIADMVEAATDLTVNSLMFDVVISQNNIAPSEAVHADVKVTVTEEILANFKAALTDLGNEAYYEYMVEGVTVGQEYPIPSFYYKQLSGGTYAYGISYSVAEAEEGFDYTSDSSFSWDNEGKKVRNGFNAVMKYDDKPSTFKNEFTYDDAIKGCALAYLIDVPQFTDTSVVKIREDNANSGGVYISLTEKNFEAYTTYAYADDNGGAIRVEWDGVPWDISFDSTGGNVVDGLGAYEAKVLAAKAQLAGIADVSL